MEKTAFKTFTLPISKSGKSQIVPPPPWIYAIEMIGVDILFNKDNLSELVPSPLEAEGEGFIYIAKIFTIAGNRYELLYEDPEETKYMESAVFLKVKYKGNIYTYSPFMWVDKDMPLIRGWLLGYPKKLAIISMSEFHKLLEGYEGPKAGITVGGYALRNGKEIVRMKINLKEKVDKSPIPYGPIVQFRRFPSVQDGQDVYELGQIISSDFKLGEVWKGDAEISLGSSINDELNLLKAESIISGYYLNWAFKQHGFKVLERF
ncbi:acetoacetate decarboxylase family protein [Acidianus manzaensis]|uniref:Acetoacetate decarboxylase n=1 Tax=Acidianus manzaensis TaxID=282676 RepID=A0A1W6JWS4_9CREN|nr:acetoacetate decarboxylase family protein [Acidianus manzaensis]ARM74708.1 acetoacetate decarboxylase [Acidianus manzaensis]